ncbi:hypothetical protein LCGC14_1318640 [marine sediment metagenome]|uniref:Uncharacterized protein n=1 Tax=marine sediment metagenome TaxID=412755 RepID=A0A0F9L5G7_9ZZZZ
MLSFNLHSAMDNRIDKNVPLYTFLSSTARYDGELIFYYMNVDFDELAFIKKSKKNLNCALSIVSEEFKNRIKKNMDHLNSIPYGYFIYDPTRGKLLYDLNKKTILNPMDITSIPTVKTKECLTSILGISSRYIYRIYNDGNLVSLLYAMYVANNMLIKPANGTVSPFGIDFIIAYLKKKYNTAGSSVLSTYIYSYLSPSKVKSAISEESLVQFTSKFYKYLEREEATKDDDTNEFTLSYILDHGLVTDTKLKDIELDIKIPGLNRMSTRNGVAYIYCNKRYQNDIFNSLQDVLLEDEMIFRIELL